MMILFVMEVESFFHWMTHIHNAVNAETVPASLFLSADVEEIVSTVRFYLDSFVTDLAVAPSQLFN